jgi:hypothetical protein
MENEFKPLSQEDIEALARKARASRETLAETDPDIPVEPEGPLPKVINLTGLDVSSVVPNIAPPPSQLAPASLMSFSESDYEVRPSVEPVTNNGEIEKLEQSLAQANATIHQLRQEFETLVQQVQVLAKGIEDISRGLKDTPNYRVRENFTCGTCESSKNVAMPVKCTSCGRVNWWGWWPPKGE